METYPCTHGFFFALIVGGGKKKAKRYNKKDQFTSTFSLKKIKSFLQKGNIN